MRPVSHTVPPQGIGHTVYHVSTDFYDENSWYWVSGDSEGSNHESLIIESLILHEILERYRLVKCPWWA